MTVTLAPFARHDGEEVTEALLESPQARLRVLSWGCVLRDWRAGPEGRAVTLGFERFEDYQRHSPSFGAIVGRVANRISNARFRLGGAEVRLPSNEGRHHLHGGPVGLGRRNWRMEADAAATSIRLTRHSADGEDGYPGAVAFEVVMRLSGARLDFEMRARPDRPTPINLAQHSYWNLDGAGDVLDHRLRVAAAEFTETDAELIPTGRRRAVAGGPLDFRAPRALRDAAGQPLALDHNFILYPARGEAPAAELLASRGDLRLRLWTDQPGLQVYDAPGLASPVPGLDGRRYGAFAGLCLEPQNFPDAVNRPEFPDPVFSPDRPYVQRLSVEIAPP